MIRIKKPDDPSKHYIKKDDLHNAVMDYQEKYFTAEKEGKPTPQQPDIIGRYILMLTEKLSTRYNFNRYSYIDMMVDDAIEHCIKAIIKYRPDKTDNIFNYFTTIAWRAFQSRIIEERKQNAIKHRHYQHTHRILELQGEIVMDGSNNEHSNRVIQEYEEKHINKPLTTKTKNANVKGVTVFIEKEKNYDKDAFDSANRSGSRGRPAKRKK